MFKTLIKWILERCRYPDYVYHVNVMEKNGQTYLPDMYGNYGPRPMEYRDLAGRWSLGWRP